MASNGKLVYEYRENKTSFNTSHAQGVILNTWLEGKDFFFKS
jgi:hypothetical protein